MTETLPDKSVDIPWSLYREFISLMPIACVDVVIIHEGKALLVQRADEPACGEMWTPGGRVLKGELLREAAHRKAFGETGIDCRVGPVVHVAETLFKSGPDGIPIHSINHCFLMHPRTSRFEIDLDVHHTSWEWVEIIRPTFHPYVKACLLGAGFGEQSRSIQNSNLLVDEKKTGSDLYRIDFGGQTS